MDEAVERMGWGVNAVWAMSRALDSEDNDAADGVHVVWEYLNAVQRQLRERLDVCMREEKEEIMG